MRHQIGTHMPEALATRSGQSAPRPALPPEDADCLAAGAAIRTLTAWRWPIIVGAVLLALVEIPYLVAVSQERRGLEFVGMFWSPHDVSQYLAAMREGAGGSWLIRDHLTSEPHPPALMYVLYVLLGKLAAAIAVPFERAYMLAATVGRLVLILSVYWATGLVTDRPDRRRLAFMLVLLGSGMTAFVGVVARLFDLHVGLAAPELNRPEVSTFLTLFTAPHLTLGLALLLGIGRAVALANAGNRLAAVAAGGMSLALGVVNPFSLATVCAVLVAFLSVQAVRRQLTVVAVIGVGGVLAAAAPFLLYSLLVFTADPFWGATYGRQNQTLTDPPLDLLVGLGILAPLALAGAWSMRRELTPGRLLVLTWIGVSVVLMYAPVGFQRRFSFGLHPMLAMLAAFGLAPLWRMLTSAQRPPLLLVQFTGRALAAQALIGSTLFLYIACLMGTFGPPLDRVGASDALADRTAFQPANLRVVADWLAARVGPDDVVLGHTLTGNYLAGIVPGRVYVGHWVATLDFSRKQGEVRQFYGGPLDRERAAFLFDHQIRYVVVGPHEQVLSPEIQPGSVDGVSLQQVYEADGVSVYEVSTATGTRAPAR